MQGDDRFVGLPYQEHGRDWSGVDCWGLTRLFLGEQGHLWMPRFDCCDDPATIIAHEKMRFATIEQREVQRFDVVIANEPVRAAEGKWQRAAIHMGVLINESQVLHITRGHSSRIDPLLSLAVAEIRRVIQWT
jgi:cell wall-associated NlpC family hydrolase